MSLGKYTAVNDDFLQAFGFSDSDEVVGLNDEQLIDKVLSSGESGKMFHHSYRGESITDLPKIWQAHDDEVLASRERCGSRNAPSSRVATT